MQHNVSRSVRLGAYHNGKQGFDCEGSVSMQCIGGSGAGRLCFRLASGVLAQSPGDTGDTGDTNPIGDLIIDLYRRFAPDEHWWSLDAAAAAALAVTVAAAHG